jgi:hypothetical protein
VIDLWLITLQLLISDNTSEWHCQTNCYMKFRVSVCLGSQWALPGWTWLTVWTPHLDLHTGTVRRIYSAFI